MKNKYLYSLLIFISISNETLNAQKQPIDYVNTFIGTGMQGNTYPAAQAPFGMLSAGPGNTFKNYDEVDARPVINMLKRKYADLPLRISVVLAAMPCRTSCSCPQAMKWILHL